MNFKVDLQIQRAYAAREIFELICQSIEYFIFQKFNYKFEIVAWYFIDKINPLIYGYIHLWNKLFFKGDQYS